MSKKAYVPVNVLARSSAPVGVNEGDVYVDTATWSLKIYNGTTWVSQKVESYGFADGGSPISVYGTIRPIDGGFAASNTFSNSPIDGGGV
jgi:hypothetical protein